MGCCSSDRNKDMVILETKSLVEAMETIKYKKKKKMEETAQLRCYMNDSNKFKAKYKVL